MSPSVGKVEESTESTDQSKFLRTKAMGSARAPRGLFRALAEQERASDSFTV